LLEDGFWDDTKKLWTEETIDRKIMRKIIM
jgi:hypothetical protein